MYVKMRKLLFVSLLALYHAFVSAVPLSNGNMTKCLTTAPHNISNVELLGRWHLAFLLFHETVQDIEVIEKEAACLKVFIERVNSTYWNQIWSIHPSKKNGMTLELPTVLDNNGQWTVISPFGVPLHVTVIHAIPQNHMILMFCAGEHEFLYLWTAVLTRKKKLSPTDLKKLSKIITHKDLGSVPSHITTWHYC